MAVPEAVVEVELSRLKTLSYLPVEPELIASGIQPCGLAILVKLNVAPLQGERHGSAVPMVFMP